MLRVLVTRPEPGAARTAKALEAMGHRPILLPLSETRPLPVDAGALPARIDAVAATSANALRLAPSALVARLAALACHAVGAKTAEAARAAGFAHVEEGPGDAEALAARIGPGLAGKSLAYLCGRVRLSRFEERLAATGVRVAAVETYDTVEIEPSSESVTARLGGAGVGAVLIYSAKAAQAAGRLAARPE
ncbi:MAG: uroporphyrinogen-III synthase, partial [Mesorhizobium sp.]